MKNVFAPTALAFGVLGMSACQTAPAGPSGFLSGYEGAASPGDSLRASVLQRRDDAAAAIERVYLERAVLVGDAATELEAADVARVLQEVDRQICFEISERFTVVGQPAPDAGRVRVGVTRILPTGAAGSVMSAAASWFIPGPVGVRVPGSTGGLAAEAELLAPGEARQVAMIAWARNATAVGTDDPSLSRVGDALQFAEPLGDAVGDAFAPQDRAVRPIAEPDPCRAYGPRRNIAASIAQRVVGFGTGLYVPEVSGTGTAPVDPPEDEPAKPRAVGVSRHGTHGSERPRGTSTDPANGQDATAAEEGKEGPEQMD